jgi:calmodulin
MSHGLTDEQVIEFQDVFKGLSGGEDSLPLDKIHDLFEAFGVSSLSDAEYNDFCDKIDAEDISLDAYLNLMGSMLKDSANEQEIVAAFQVFDEKQSGSIPTTQLKHVLSTFCDKLTPEDIDKIATDADPKGSGKVEYKKLVKNMLKA